MQVILQCDDKKGERPERPETDATRAAARGVRDARATNLGRWLACPRLPSYNAAAQSLFISKC